jgi:DNA-binding response OmpR family regulator
MQAPRILVIDDEPRIRTLLRRSLEDGGFRVVEAEGRADALAALDGGDIDLVTLDLSLGAEDGLDLARELNAVRPVPLVMVTSRDDVIDRVVGLELGADDYITKPFHPREVLARVRSVLRRARGTLPAEARRCRVDGITVDLDRLEVVDRDGRPVQMTGADMRLFEVFLMHPKRVLSREQMMDLLGGGQWSPLDRTIDNQVARLRKKIESDPADPHLVKTVRGVGYTLAADVAWDASVAVEQ